MKFPHPFGNLLVGLALAVLRSPRVFATLLGFFSVAAITQGAQVATPTLTPGTGTYASTQNVTIATTTSGASIRYTTNGTNPTSTTGTLYSGPVAISTSNTLKAIAYKSGWTNSTVASATYTIDTTAPSVSVTAPASGATVAGITAVSATASDNVGVAGVQFLLDGVNLGAEDTSPPYTIPWNATAASAGAHSLTARVRDTAGNQTTSAAVPVTVINASLVASDNFDRTNGALGTNWFDVPGPDTTSVVSGFRVTTATSGFSVSRWAGTGSFAADQYSKITAINPGGAVEVTVRGTGSTPMGAKYYAFGVTGSGWFLYKLKDGADIQLSPNGSWPGGSFTPTGSDIIELRAIGSTLTGYINGVQIVSVPVPDPDFQTGVPGLNIFQSGVADNWEGGNLTASVADTTPPSLSNGLPAGPLAAGTTQATLSLTSNENATSRYSTTPGVPYTSMTNTFTTTGGTSHSTIVTGLANGTTYTYYVRSSDSSGNVTTTDFPISFTVSAPTPVTTTTTVTAITAPAYNPSTQNLPVSATISGSPTPNGGTVTFTFRNSGGTALASTSGAVTGGTASGTISIPAGTAAAPGYYVTASYTGYTADNYSWNNSSGNSTAFAISPASQATVSISPSAQTINAGGNIIFTAAGGTGTGAYTWGGSASGTGPTKTVSFPTAGTFTVTVYRATDGNYSQSAAATASITVNSPDTTYPTVSVTAPAASATVSGTTIVSATASDNVGIAGVQFRLDGTNLGSEDTSSPYSISWDTNTASSGIHALTALARDAAGNQTISAAVSVTVSGATSPANQIAALAFSEGSGTAVADLSGSGHAGMLGNGPTWAAGKFGTGLTVDGVDDYVALASPGTLNFGTSDFTIAVWVRRTGIGTANLLFLKGDESGAPEGSKQLYIDGSNILVFQAYNVGIVSSTGTIPNDGLWHHVAVTFADSPNTIAFYVDGVARGGGTVNLPADIVGHVVVAGYGFNGQIDELRLFSRALSLSEIQTVMNNAIVPPPTDTTAPTLSNGQPVGALAAGTTQATLSLTTSENATSRYSTTPNVPYASMSGTFTTTGGTSHSTVVTGLTNGGNYTYYVRSMDAAGNATTTDFPITFSVAAASQTITFTNPGTQTYGTPLTLSATASSGLSVGYSVTSGPATVSGNVVTFTGIGSVTVRASQAGNASFGAATDVSRTFTVDPQLITFSLNQTSFTYSGNAQGPTVVPSVSGATFTTGGTLSATAANNYTASASATGNYSGSNANLTWSIVAASQTITFSFPGSQTYGTPLTLSATASSGLSVGYSVTSGPATVSGNVLTFTGTGSVTVRATQTGNASFGAATPVDQTFTVNPRPITVTLSGSKTYDGNAHSDNANATLTGGTLASGDSLSFSYSDTYGASAATYTGLAVASITNPVAPSIRTNSYTITQTGSYTINPAGNQSAVSINSPSNFVYGDAYNATITGGSGSEPAKWALGAGSTAAGAAIDPVSGTITAKSTGTVVIKAQRLGDTNFPDSSWTADYTVNVKPRPIMVTLSGSRIYDGTVAYTGAQASLTIGTLANGDSISFSFANTPSASANIYTNLATATITNAGVSRTASYAISYNGSYAITSAVNSGVVSITSPASFLFGAPYRATANGGSGTGSYSWALGSGTNSAGAAIDPDAGTVTASGAGTFSIKAKKRNDDNYADSAWSADFMVTVLPNAIPTVTMSIKGTTGNSNGLGPTVNAMRGEIVPITISGADVNGDLRFVSLWVNPTGDTKWYSIRADGTLIDASIVTDNSNPLHNALDSGGINVSSLGSSIILFSTLQFAPSDPAAYSGYYFKIFAHDSASGESVNQYVTVAVTPNPNIITSPASVQGAVGVPFQYQITASNFPQTYGIEPSLPLPPGLSLNQLSGWISGTPTVPGTYSVTIKATHPTTGFVSATLTITILPVLPYATDFESSGDGYTLGNLQGQRGWSTIQGSAVITNSDDFHGTQSVMLSAGATPAVISQVFSASGGQSIEYFDFFAKAVASSNLDSATQFMVEGNKFAFLLNGSNGVLQYFSGNGAGSGVWKFTSFAVPVNASKQTQDWVRLSVRLDFNAHKWDLYATTDLTPKMVASDIPFYSDSSTYISSFKVQGAASAASGLDYISAGPVNPLFFNYTNGVNGDLNNNGIDDAWETSHGLAITPGVSNSNRNTSPTGNGVTVVEAYVGGTNPNDIYNSTPPVLVILGGNNQAALPGKFNAQPFDVAVYNAARTVPLINAPVRFEVTSGGGKLSEVNSGNPTATFLVQATDPNEGSAQAFYQQPAGQGVQSTITFTAGGSSQIFITTSAIDSNADGIPDIWAVAYGLDPNDPTVASALFSGRPAGSSMTNLQAYLSGNYPMVLALQNAPMPITGDYQVILVTPGNRIYGVNGSYQISPLPIPVP